MKKTILILILILPVVVISLVYMIAGFVVREAAVQPVTHIYITAPIMHSNNVFRTGDDRARASNWSVNQRIDLRTFVVAQPAPRARFSALEITIEFLNPVDEYGIGAISVADGVISINREIQSLIIVRIDEFFSIEFEPRGGV